MKGWAGGVRTNVKAQRHVETSNNASIGGDISLALEANSQKNLLGISRVAAIVSTQEANNVVTECKWRP